MTVPPPVIAANRVLLATLVATNFFGQNTPAIAATEAQYMEMWAQDAAAMTGYAVSSATASVLAPFPAPPSTTAPEAGSNQADAVEQAVAEPAGNTAQSTANVTSHWRPHKCCQPPHLRRRRRRRPRPPLSRVRLLGWIT